MFNFAHESKVGDACLITDSKNIDRNGIIGKHRRTTSGH